MLYYCLSYVATAWKGLTMEAVVLGLAALACPLGMGFMMWFMARGMRKDKPAPDQRSDLGDLRAEHARLGAQIERLEQDTNGHGARPVERA